MLHVIPYKPRAAFLPTNGEGKMKHKIYGYGIVDGKGIPWEIEDYVCKDRRPLDEHVHGLNWDHDNVSASGKLGRPYRVVRLLFGAKK